jgi:Lysine-specific metallo-endopeptidase
VSRQAIPFGTESTSQDEIKAIAVKLAYGFKKITNVCNANNLIFSDDPGDRRSMSEYDDLYASVWRRGEGNLKVMYIAGNFKKSGNSGSIWLCALTIIHEATHLELDTKDIRLDRQGIKPGAGLTVVDALNNADSWGYFCIDLCGHLSQADMRAALR